MMKKLFLATLAVAALTAPVQAADMPTKAPTARVATTWAGWSGCYVGGSFGAMWGISQQTYGGDRAGLPDAFLPVGYDVTGHYSVPGILGGAQVGCNHQTGNWVWGIEVDGSGVIASRAVHPVEGAVAAGANPQRRFHTKENWLATARGRVGYATNRWLWYVTGGAAWAGLEVNNEAILVAADAARTPDKVDRFGWVAGLGAEYALSGGWSVKGEFLYVDFGTFHYSDSPAANGCVQCYSMNVKLHEFIFRLGVNYQFGGAVVSRN